MLTSEYQFSFTCFEDCIEDFASKLEDKAQSCLFYCIVLLCVLFHCICCGSGCHNMYELWCHREVMFNVKLPAEDAENGEPENTGPGK